MVLLRLLTLAAFVGSNAYVQGFGIRSSPCPVASNICVVGNCHGTIPRISPSYRKSGSATSLKMSVTSSSTSTTPDFTQMLTYGVATGVQFGILSGALHSIDLVVAKSSLTKLPLPVVALLFVFLSLRSRVASPLDNSRPKKKELKGKATPPDIKRPSWTPPGIAFPFIWLTITALRGISSALVYDTVGGKLFSPPLLAMILHLSIGDTWNTITNLERRLGVSAIGVLAVWASVMNAIARYYRAIPLAGKILAPSGVWISIATVLTMTIWRINKPVQPIWPVKGDGKSAKFKLSNLGQLQQPDSVEDSSEPTVERINEKVDLDSPKVATMEKLQAPSKKVYCRCWKSDTFPLCDGAHMKHNEATGDNVGPLIVTAKKEDK